MPKKKKATLKAVVGFSLVAILIVYCAEMILVHGFDVDAHILGSLKYLVPIIVIVGIVLALRK